MIATMTPSRDKGPAQAPQSYLPTSWTLIESVQKGSPQARADAMDRMVRLYWRPIYWTIRRQWGAGPEEARELTQGFLLYFLDRELIMKVQKEKGRFRAWIKATLRNFMREHTRNQRSLKRGGGRRLVCLEELQEVEAAPPSREDPPDRVFERELVRALIDEALERLSRRMAAEGKGKAFEVFRHFYFEEGQGRKPTYEDLGRRFELGFHQVKNMLAETRVAYRSELLALIGATTADARDALREILEVFGS